ncbi:MAG: hypothetical protein ACYTHN_04015, partial [Planctomycetota bacterium]
MEDSLHGIMMLKGYVTEEEAGLIRSELLSRDIDFPEIAPGSVGPQFAQPTEPETKVDPRRYRFYLDEAERKEVEGDIEAALKACQKAKPFTDDPKEVEEKIQALDRRIQEKDRVAQYLRYQQEVREKAKDRDFEGALHVCRVARGLAQDPTQVDKVIASLRAQAWKERERKALQIALSSSLGDGIAVLQEGRDLVDDPEMVTRAAEALKRSVDMRTNTDRYAVMAETLEKKGDVVGAAEVLDKLAATMADPSSVMQKLTELKKRAYEQCMVEARKKEWVGDFEAAIEACRRARGFTHRSEILDRKIATLLRKSQRRERHQNLQEEADELLALGNEKAALEKLKDCLTYTDKPGLIRERIQRISGDLVRSAMAKVAELEEEGRTEEALAEARTARGFAFEDQITPVEEKIRSLERAQEEATKRRKVSELLAEADSLIAEGEVWRGIDRITAARTWAEDTAEIDARIEETIRVEYEKNISQAEKAEGAKDLKAALESYERAREWARGREEELKARIDEVQSRLDKEEREGRLAALLAEAEEALSTGEPREAVSLFKKAIDFTEDPAEIETRISAVLVGEKEK